MSNPNIIVIPKASDKTYGFLSNDSKHAFVLKDKYTDKFVYWPTVTHYIEAKKFEGTQYEETIRNAKTVAQVRLLARERNIRITMEGSNTNAFDTTRESVGSDYNIVTSKKVYGNKRVMQHPKATWENDLERNLNVALIHKFSQHASLKNLLVSTAPLIIDGCGDTVSDTTAQIIMEIREKFILEI